MKIEPLAALAAACHVSLNGWSAAWQPGTARRQWRLPLPPLLSRCLAAPRPPLLRCYPAAIPWLRRAARAWARLRWSLPSRPQWRRSARPDKAIETVTAIAGRQLPDDPKGLAAASHDLCGADRAGGTARLTRRMLVRNAGEAAHGRHPHGDHRAGTCVTDCA